MGLVPEDRSKETEDELESLQTSWEGEYLGVGFFEGLRDKFPEYADEFQACMAMEWFNIHYCAPIAHDVGVHLTLEQADKRRQQGRDIAGTMDTFEAAAKAVADETPDTVKMYAKMSENASNPQLKALGTDFCEHELSFCAWMQSVVEGNSDGAKRVFAYLENHGVTREEALAPLEV